MQWSSDLATHCVDIILGMSMVVYGPGSMGNHGPMLVPGHSDGVKRMY